MKCPYCNKRTTDMPTHLEKNFKCWENHRNTLSIQISNILVINKTREKKTDEK